MTKKTKNSQPQQHSIFSPDNKLVYNTKCPWACGVTTDELKDQPPK
jgi:hypothetical protein